MYKIRVCSIRVNYTDREGSKYAEKTLFYYYIVGHNTHGLSWKQTTASLRSEFDD